MNNVEIHQSDLQIERELLAILTGLRLKLDSREAIYCLLHDDDEAPVVDIIAYFLEQKLSLESAKELWKGLLNYRLELGKVYGQRISLHIAIYHLMRDPEALRQLGMDDGLEVKKNVQLLAVQELKAWWERCSETGIHLWEVMDQQLERLVYHGLKSKTDLSFVLLRLHHTTGREVNEEDRAEVARFLMDACRCRDIVGHYRDHHFALIFPQTPRQGARIAIERLKSSFHRKFKEGQPVLTFAIANCPENGRKGRELSLVASRTLQGCPLDEMDRVVECEGETPWFQQCWAFHLKNPLFSLLKSPLKLAALILLLFASGMAFRYLQWDREPQWRIVHEQVLREEGTFSGWQWGRGGEDRFALEAGDGFVLSSGEVMVESLDDLWFSVPVEIKGDLRLSLDLKLALGSSLVLSLGDGFQNRNLAVEISERSIALVDDGVVMEWIPLSMNSLEEVHFDFTWTASGVEVRLDGEVYQRDGRWGEGEPWPSRLFLTALNGYALVSELKCSSRPAGTFYQRELGRWERDFVELRDEGPSAWAEKMLKAPARMEEVLRQNLVRRLDLELGHDQRGKRPEWVQKWGETVLGGGEIWLHWLTNAEYKGLKSTWGENNIKRSATLRSLVKAAESDTPVAELKTYVDAELWGSAKDLFLKTCLVMDWGPHRLDVAQWAWEERFKDIGELSALERLNLAIGFLRDELAPEDQHLVLRACEVLLQLGDQQAREVYLAMASHPMVMDLMLSWKNDRNQALLAMLKAKAALLKGEEVPSLQNLGSWMSNTDLGKVLKYDWMWLCLNSPLTSEEDQFYFHKELTLQSRYPELARAALALGRGGAK